MQDDPATADSWLIGLDSWIVQDGNYPDFVSGRPAEFALEYAARGGLRLLDGPHEPSVRWVEGSRYEVTAQVVHDRPNAEVLDFGLLAYHFVGIEDPAHRPRPGAWVTGEINLSVDPFFYVDQLAHEDGFPALVYAWTVEEILQRVDAPEPGFVAIEQTDVWADVHSLPSYLLRCRQESATRTRAFHAR